MNQTLSKFSLLSLAALLCMAGQFPRKEVREVPSTQVTAENAEAQQNQAPKQEKRKSAAKRSMEKGAETTLNRVSAAKRSMQTVD